MSEKINTPCPACGQGTLIVGAGGYLTCGLLGCPDPTMLDRILSDPYVRDHIVTFHQDGDDASFSIQHPLSERCTDLVACSLHGYLRSLDGPPAKPGRYRAWQDHEDRWCWAEIA